MMLDVFGEIDDGHATRTDLALDHVAAGKPLADVCGLLARRAPAESR